MNKKLKSDLMLLLTAIIWGSSFVAQKSGTETIGPFTFNGVRTLIGALVLIPVIYILSRKKSATSDSTGDMIEGNVGNIRSRKTLITGGICCGIALFIAGSLQQIGIIYTTSGKSGFITALYVVLVPILGLITGKRPRLIVWICVVAAAVGLYLLCIPSGEGGIGSINIGDWITLICALAYSVHIMVIDHFSPKADGVKLSCLQFFVVFILSVPGMFLIDPMIHMADVTEAVTNPVTGEIISKAVVTVSDACYGLPDPGTLLNCWLPIMYSGLMSCGIAYTLQVVAQADAEPSVAAMIMCLESVFAVIGGMVILGELMSLRELIGCLIMFAAIVMAQLPSGQPKIQSKESV